MINMMTMSNFELYKAVQFICEDQGSSRLTVAIFNALLRGGIRTIDDLIEADEEYLANIRNVGARKLELIMDIKRSINKD